ncbi:MAG: hypothetical protein M5U12_14560 [Verrucomicrobia bacterium]|nr:hypothetical protein [Verrucomicrobiota bacterium]
MLAAGGPADSAGDQTLLEGLAQVTLGRLAQLKQERALPLRLVPNTDLLAERVESVNEARRRLGATHVLSLRWLQDLDRTRLSITLEDTRTADTVGADILEVVDANLLSAGQRVAEQVAAWLRLSDAPFSRPCAAPPRPPTPKPTGSTCKAWVNWAAMIRAFRPAMPLVCSKAR